MPLLKQLNLCFPGHFILKAVCDHIDTLMAPLDNCDIMYSMFSSHFAREPVLGFCRQARHKAACAAAVYSVWLEISNTCKDTKVSLRQRQSKALSNVRGCFYHEKKLGDSLG